MDINKNDNGLSIIKPKTQQGGLKSKNALSKSVSNDSKSTILEENEQADGVNKRANSFNKNVWTRKQYNNRRKSTDFTNIGEQRGINNKV